ncbi:sensor histidine kinase [Inhella proteolytica]|uniref:histidine kinase n=1 Tax=Inhella proteolytica TaxID=2795029 RepID=A0A931J1U5_9BURK|nr:PAS domain S-box protein [Inhella proteolytica]MBH9576133.1 PAS domain S-box protein [Inhella proteolytica]
MPALPRLLLRLLRRGLWALPALLALVFVAAVLAWALADEAAERERERQTLIADALSAATPLRAQLALERAALRNLAATLRERPDALLGAQPEVEAGLQGLWTGITWLDGDNRVKEQLPLQPRRNEGLSLHLQQPLPQGSLVLRYSPAQLLKQALPWWLARRYDVQIIDGNEQVIAALTHAPVRMEADTRPSYRVALDDSAPDASLELILREPSPAGLRPLVGVLIAGFIPLSMAASWGLRRQMQRVQRAEARWRAEAAWRAAVENSALVGLRARDAGGRLLSVNRTFCELVGFSEAELVGRAPPMPYWPPDAIQEVMQRSERSLAGQAPREGYEARWRHRSGRELDVLVFESPLVDAAGQQIGWLGTILDITERKRLAEREARQVEAQAQAARLTMLGEVASTLAHELNQPLTAIASYNAGVLNSLQRLGVADAPVLGALQRLGEQAAQAGRVVQRIRQFLTRHEPQLEPCALNPVLESALALLAKEFQRRGIEVDVQLDAALPAVQADAVLIEQVAINLLRNAADALLDQPGARQVRLSSRRAGGFVIVDVCDNGPGLAGRAPEALFAPFYSTKPEGMGMGLAICRSIIEAHHGVLDAGTATLGGARFSFSLPCP